MTLSDSGIGLDREVGPRQLEFIPWREIDDVKVHSQPYEHEEGEMDVIEGITLCFSPQYSAQLSQPELHLKTGQLRISLPDFTHLLDTYRARGNTIN